MKTNFTLKERFCLSRKDRIVSLLYPRVCPECGEIISCAEQKRTVNERNANPFICKECYLRLCFPTEPRCIKCSRPVESDEQDLCDNCRKKQRYFDQGGAVVMHDEISRKIIYDLKYSNRRDNADMMAWETAKQCIEYIKFWKPELLIPVPLHPDRAFQRGFNQAEIFGRKLSKYLRNQGLELPLEEHCLVRVKKTSAQKELGAEQREKNLEGAFMVNPDFLQKDGKFPFCRVLLIDDIYTSGATLSECARVLKQTGVEQVYFLTFSIG